MKLSRSQLLLLVALVAVGLLAWFAPKEEGDGSDLVEPAARTRQQAVAAAATGSKENTGASTQSSTLTPTLREAADPKTPDLFKATSWYVPPPPPPTRPSIPPPPPPPPQAPPLPFAFMGRYDDGVKPIYLLARGDLVVTASIGDKLDGSYQLEALQGNSLVINYLPLNQKQTLDVGAPR